MHQGPFINNNVGGTKQKFHGPLAFFKNLMLVTCVLLHHACIVSFVEGALCQIN